MPGWVASPLLAKPIIWVRIGIRLTRCGTVALSAPRFRVKPRPRHRPGVRSTPSSYQACYRRQERTWTQGCLPVYAVLYMDGDQHSLSAVDSCGNGNQVGDGCLLQRDPPKIRSYSRKRSSNDDRERVYRLKLVADVRRCERPDSLSAHTADIRGGACISIYPTQSPDSTRPRVRIGGYSQHH